MSRPVHRLTGFRLLAIVLVLCCPATPCFAWAECGHHIVSVIAFNLLTESEQTKLMELLSKHPRYTEDFTPPDSIAISSANWWRIGRAGAWPDIARDYPTYNRPTWHYQLGATLVIGDREAMNVPLDPGPVSEEATMETRDLHVVQAIALCRRVYGDSDADPADRALAICWLSHLVGDLHQPCHAGSLYYEGLFPRGDRGANSIPTRQGRNLHAFWDGLLGGRFDAADVRRRTREIVTNRGVMIRAAEAAEREGGLDAMTWVRESRRAGAAYVYSPEVFDAVVETARQGKKRMDRVDLPEPYLTRAGYLSRIRVAEAAHRLAAIWRAGLN